MEIANREVNTIPDTLNLRAGEWVEVRSANEILRTLDASQSLEALPFMPEMLQYCGKKFRVYKAAHKTCDTVKSYAIRRMSRTVHLEGLRCDGSAHGGCQALCLLYWKEAWLRRTTAPESLPQESTREAADHTHWAALLQGTRVTNMAQEDFFRCQATDLRHFTTEVRRRRRWDPRLYLKDLTSRNVKPLDFVRYGLLAMLNAFLEGRFGWRFPHIHGTLSKQTPSAQLNLQPGDFVQVRSKKEIMRTLGMNMKNRGLHFDVEMVPFCEGQPRRVLTRVERIVDEKTGRLITLPNPCVILEGVTCSGMLSTSRMFCPRSIYPYWREIWLKRIEETPAANNQKEQYN